MLRHELQSLLKGVCLQSGTESCVTTVLMDQWRILTTMLTLDEAWQRRAATSSSSGQFAYFVNVKMCQDIHRDVLFNCALHMLKVNKKMSTNDG